MMKKIFEKIRYRRSHISDDEDDDFENLDPRDKFRFKTFGKFIRIKSCTESISTPK